MNKILKKILENILFHNFKNSTSLITFLNQNWEDQVVWQNFSAKLTKSDIEEVTDEDDEEALDCYEYQFIIDIYFNNNKNPFLTASSSILIEIEVLKEDILNLEWDFQLHDSQLNGELLVELLKIQP